MGLALYWRLYHRQSCSRYIIFSFEFVSDRLINLLYTAAVNNIQSEPLAPNFSEVLGIALPLNSIIFSINAAPSFHFLSLTLSRPGSDQVQSALGIGKHPTAFVPDPSDIQYSTPVIDASGSLFWKTTENYYRLCRQVLFVK